MAVLANHQRLADRHLYFYDVFNHSQISTNLHFFLSLAAASAALLCGIGTAHAVPAKPGLIQVTQSDGTQLTVRLVGDERRHYMLSSDGYTLTGGPDGDLYYAELFRLREN